MTGNSGTYVSKHLIMGISVVCQDGKQRLKDLELYIDTLAEQTTQSV